MAINLVKISSPICTWLFGAGDWSPNFTANLPGVTAGNLVISIGGWWDINDQGVAQRIPTDSNGTLLGAGNASPNVPGTTPVPGWPVTPQICYIANAAQGTHVLTPFNLGSGADGYFMAAEFSSPGATWSLVDSGFAFSGSTTPGAVQTLTVSTAGSAAQVGDLVVVALAADGDPTAVEMGPPGGYDRLAANPTVLDNVTFGAGWKTCSAAGTQTQVWNWSDTATEMAQGVVAVFRPTVTAGTSMAPTGARRAAPRAIRGDFNVRKWW